MLSHAKEHESLTGKLLLSSALVAVTLGYYWWQHNEMSQQQAAAIAAMQMPAAPAQAPAQAQAQTQAQTQAMSAAPQTAGPTPDAAAQSETSAPAADNSSTFHAAAGLPPAITARLPFSAKNSGSRASVPSRSGMTRDPMRFRLMLRAAARYWRENRGRCRSPRQSQRGWRTH